MPAIMPRPNYRHIEDLRSHLLAGSVDARKARARKAGTTVPYLEKLAGGHGLPSMKMAKALIESTPGLKWDHFLRAHEERASVGRVRRKRKKG